ncbi:hypothetical protein BGX20_000059 [Mortierella sp. AD010]|nr:hypothetical protein BGX20_000059 [Mortierella sp. AD010]
MAQENNSRCAARTFEVLEILLLILSYLPPSQLRIGPTLVCRQWHVVCLLFITNTTTWDSRIVSKNSKEETVFNQRIKTTDILRCHIEDDRWGARDAIKSLTQSIASLSNNGQHHRIQKLDFTHRDDNPQGILVLNIFAPLRFLTSLRIRTQSVAIRIFSAAGIGPRLYGTEIARQIFPKQSDERASK